MMEHIAVVIAKEVGYTPGNPSQGHGGTMDNLEHLSKEPEVSLFYSLSLSTSTLQEISAYHTSFI